MADQSLERFVLHQSGKGVDGRHVISFATALAEIRSGAKTSHWIWYIFPQFRDASRKSAMNDFFQLRSRDEALGFMKHAVLWPRYIDILTGVLVHVDRGAPLRAVMGSAVDAKKAFQSVSSFYLVARTLPVDSEVGMNGTGKVLATALCQFAQSIDAHAGGSSVDRLKPFRSEIPADDLVDPTMARRWSELE
jgi:uncharacterized protein (DUF1810 family)